MVEITNKTKQKINRSEIEKIVEEFLKHYKIKAKEVSIVFIGDKKMRELNKSYRGIDKTTDILSFNGEGDFLGEIIISPAQIKKQAREFSKGSFRKELIFILVHGLLHLLGYDDANEKGREKMIRIGEEFINNYKINLLAS
jgi:probable rRNA maturation factor